MNELYKLLSQEQAIKKGVDVLVLNIQRECAVRGVDIKKKEVIKVVTKLLEERVNG